MKTAFIYDGQGNDDLLLGRDFYEKEELVRNLYDNCSNVFNVSKEVFSKDPIMLKTDKLQPSIFLQEMAISLLLEKNGIKADVVCGSSLGEFSALCYSGILSIEDTLKILIKRGELMNNYLSKIDSGMNAIMFLDYDIVCECVAKFNNCEISNINSSGQVVISGLSEDLEKCSNLCSELGARRVIKLNVDGAFHSRFLQPASNEFLEYIKDFKYDIAKIPMYFNYTGKCEINDILELLSKQLYSVVLFKDMIENMIDDGVDTFYEIGPGGNLSFHISSIARSKGKKVVIYQIKDYETYLNILEKVNGE